MLRRFSLIFAVFALGIWALAPSTASAGHRDHDKGRYYKEKYDKEKYNKNKYDKGEYKWGRERHKRRWGYKQYRERPRHVRRYYNYRPHHNRRGYGKYAFDDGAYRPAYKFRKHGRKYIAPYRKRNFYDRRGGRYERQGYGYRQGGYVIQRNYVVQTLENAPDGQAIVWNDTNERARYKIVPTQSYRADNGRYCREYLSTATVGGQTREVYGKACRQEDGAWELVR